LEMHLLFNLNKRAVYFHVFTLILFKLCMFSSSLIYSLVLLLFCTRSQKVLLRYLSSSYLLFYKKPNCRTCTGASVRSLSYLHKFVSFSLSIAFCEMKIRTTYVNIWRSCDRASWHISILKPARSIIFRVYWTSLYMFRAVFPSIIRSSRLYILHDIYLIMQSVHHQEVNDANCTYAASGIVTLCKWPSCATANEGLVCWVGYWLGVGLVVMKLLWLYYDARPTKYQGVECCFK
jgi:hypothetical protein